MNLLSILLTAILGGSFGFGLTQFPPLDWIKWKLGIHLESQSANSGLKWAAWKLLNCPECLGFWCSIGLSIHYFWSVPIWEACINLLVSSVIGGFVVASFLEKKRNEGL